ncbi:hypothetical protein SLEP1_g58809 [Rubroshorea leprosula]|uniref:Cation/H(+) antiporter C-terminal domain-containing protein n=1 Tax=Rubroshorea leprosula TaxID=152421 RepID=A0AAV5MQZ0_9ROSI|nr:hypothetical protein SLEP1_g58809 [Rubroshorea leprosula]
MAEHPGISLTVIRFLPSPQISGEIVREEIKSSTRSINEQILAEHKEKIPSNGSINYEERVVRDAAETMEIAKEFSQCNLFLVGRTPEGEVAAKLNVKNDCPELGPVGSMLTYPEFSTSASVLVVQQYNNNSPHASLPPLISIKVAEVPEGDQESV